MLNINYGIENFCRPWVLRIMILFILVFLSTELSSEELYILEDNSIVIGAKVREYILDDAGVTNVTETEMPWSYTVYEIRTGFGSVTIKKDKIKKVYYSQPKEETTRSFRKSGIGFQIGYYNESDDSYYNQKAVTWV